MRLSCLVQNLTLRWERARLHHPVLLAMTNLKRSESSVSRGQMSDVETQSAHVVNQREVNQLLPLPQHHQQEFLELEQ